MRAELLPQPLLTAPLRLSPCTPTSYTPHAPTRTLPATPRQVLVFPRSSCPQELQKMQGWGSGGLPQLSAVATPAVIPSAQSRGGKTLSRLSQRGQ